MRTFSQFLQESYLNEEIPAGMTRDQFNALPADSRRRLSGGSPSALGRQGQPLQGGASAPAIRSARKGMSGTDAAAVTAITGAGGAATLAANSGDNPVKGKLDDRLSSDIKSTKVSSPARKLGDPWNQFPKKPPKQLGLSKEGPSSQVPGRKLAPAGGTTPKEALPPGSKGGALATRPTSKGGALATRPTSTTLSPTPEIKPVKVADITSKPKVFPGGGGGNPPKPSGPGGGGGGPSGPSSVGKPPITPKAPGKFAKIGKFLGPASAALDTVLSTADERSKGSGWARSLAKGATVAAGGLLGGTAGAIGGGGLLSAATGTAGAIAGGAAAEKAFDTVAGANAVQRKAIATQNRKSQAGGELKGIGGKTTFDTKKNTITTGVGPQRKTAQLAKTSVVTNPKTGKQETGYLAYKGGKATYKRAETKNLAQTSSNPLERIGRSLFAGAYKANDAKLAQQKLNTARQSDVNRNKALGVKMLPGK